MAVGEFDLIAKYFTRPVRRAVLGGGDDCALLQPTPGMQWAVSTDALVEGRHFLSTVPPDALGHKALAVNLSDLAACGARPVAFTLALALPRVDEAFLAGFAAGLLRAGRRARHASWSAATPPPARSTSASPCSARCRRARRCCARGAQAGDEL